MRIKILIFLIFALLINCKEEGNIPTINKNVVYKTVFDVTAESGLVLREKPDVKAKGIKTLKQKMTVALIKSDEKEVSINGNKGKWLYVKVLDNEKKQGWVFGYYLSESYSIIPSATIEKYLDEIDLTDKTITHEEKQGTSECSGVSTITRDYGDSLSVDYYAEYKIGYTFHKNFIPVLGVSPDFTKSQLEELWGLASGKEDNTLIYYSEKSNDYDRDYFSAKWIIRVTLENGKVSSISFSKMFDDC